jgi:hypothetical protein
MMYIEVRYDCLLRNYWFLMILSFGACINSLPIISFTVQIKLWFQGLFLCKLGQRCRSSSCVLFIFQSRVKISKEEHKRRVVYIVNDPLSYVVILSRHFAFRFQLLACACLTS